MPDCYDVVLAGAAIIDIPVSGIDASIFTRYSTPAGRIILTSGGDALNEALVLSRLGKRVRLISRVGRDGAGGYLKELCCSAGIDTQYLYETEGLDTGVNVVLVDADGERRFLTNPHGGLRALEAQDIVPDALRHAKVFCFASIFVFPRISPSDLEQIFHMVHSKGLIVCADMTSPKNHETIKDLAPALRYLDYFFANHEEARQITGLDNPNEIADALLHTGAKHIIIKLGRQGCLIADNTQKQYIPACSGTNCIDTTGAGDNFAAGFLSALLDGYSFIDCARYANACASISVESFGASAGVTSAQQVFNRFQTAYYKK